MAAKTATATVQAHVKGEVGGRDLRGASATVGTPLIDSPFFSESQDTTLALLVNWFYDAEASRTKTRRICVEAEKGSRRQGQWLQWTAMADLHISARIVIPEEELGFTFARSSGPGGQNVNKVNSKATLRWSPQRSAGLPEDVRERFLTRYASRLTNDGEILITSQESRDQPKNIAICLEKLRSMIAAVVAAPKKRRATRPTKGSKQRRLNDKKQRSDIKAGRRSIRRGE
jgi:ribosome-associated protein